MENWQQHCCGGEGTRTQFRRLLIDLKDMSALSAEVVINTAVSRALVGSLVRVAADIAKNCRYYFCHQQRQHCEILAFVL